jgi:hypothetical protein
MKYILFWCILIIFLPLLSFGQSLFGISDKTIGFLQVPYSSAGAARSFELASTDSLNVNAQNFSMWTNLSNTTISVLAGYDGASATDQEDNNYYSELFNFQGALVGVPLQKKKIVLGIGLQPISNIDRRFVDTLVTNSNEIESLYLKGGLGRAIANISYSPIRNFGLAIGYEFTFGSIKEDYIINDEDVSVYRIEVDKESRMFGTGFIFSAYLQPMQNLTVGLFNRLAVKTDVDIIRKSISTEVEEKQHDKITLPAQYGMGLEYKFKPRYKVGMDLLYQDWENGYKVDNKKLGSTQDKFFRFGVGIERTQSQKRFTDLLEQMDFRAGLFYGQLNQTNNNNSVNEYGLTFGFSLPIIRYISVLDIYGKIGRRGSLSQNTIEETFYSFGVTFSASELWFKNIED